MSEHLEERLQFFTKSHTTKAPDEIIGSLSEFILLFVNLRINTKKEESTTKY